MAGFEVTLYGRFWVSAEDLIERLPLTFESQQRANLEVSCCEVKCLSDTRPFLEVTKPVHPETLLSAIKSHGLVSQRSFTLSYKLWPDGPREITDCTALEQ